jgi:hypothetical protein
MRSMHAIAVLAVLAGCEMVQDVSDSLGGKIRDHQTPEFDREKYGRIAVVAEQPAVGAQSDAAARAADTSFTGVFMEKGYSVSSRGDVSTAMSEVMRSKSGMTDGEAKKLGKVLNVQGVLIVSVDDFAGSPVRTSNGTGYKTRTRVTARLVDVETSQAHWTCTGALESTSDMNQPDPEVVHRIAERMAEKFPDRKTPNQPPGPPAHPH